MKAHKLKSGRWNCRVFVGYDSSGKRKYKSITADTKRECEREAAMFSGAAALSLQVTVRDAILDYIDSKRNVLSPSTITAYDSMAGSSFDDISHCYVDAITSEDVQRWINTISSSDTPKTVRNKYGLLQAACKAKTGKVFSVSLPARKRPDLYTPASADIAALLAHTAANPRSLELYLSIALAAFCGLRMGEICALEAEDFHDGVVEIKKARVIRSDGVYVTKQPKTYSSYRQVRVPGFILERIPATSGRIITADVKAMSDRFRRAVRYTFHGTKSFRFHDLRHYYASMTHALGVPDEYIMESGGWKTDHVMKRVYRDALPDEREKQSKKVLEYFEKMGNL